MLNRNNKKFVSAIVVAAGSSKRFKGGVKKQFFKIKEEELFLRPVKALCESALVDEVVVVLPAGDLNEFGKTLKHKKIISVAAGGSTRPESVRNGLSKISKMADYVIVQDGARPFLKEVYIKDCLDALKKYDGAVAAVKVSDTIKKASPEGVVKATVPRFDLYRAQTPQAFRKDILLKAYSRKNVGAVTDDSALVEKIGGKIKIVEASESNIKVTKMEDIRIVEYLIKNEK